jgi:uncharacterized DUF497 family protein
MSLVFEWDIRKARSNYTKHNIGFGEAVPVFSDTLARIFPDEEHSAEEFREIIIRTFRGEAALVGLLYGAGNGPCPHRQCTPRHQGRAARL